MDQYNKGGRIDTEYSGVFDEDFEVRLYSQDELSSDDDNENMTPTRRKLFNASSMHEEIWPTPESVSAKTVACEEVWPTPENSNVRAKKVSCDVRLSESVNISPLKVASDGKRTFIGDRPKKMTPLCRNLFSKSEEVWPTPENRVVRSKVVASDFRPIENFGERPSSCSRGVRSKVVACDFRRNPKEQYFGAKVTSSEVSKNMSESSKNTREASNNRSEMSKNWSEASKNWSEASKNRNEMSKNKSKISEASENRNEAISKNMPQNSLEYLGNNLNNHKKSSTIYEKRSKLLAWFKEKHGDNVVNNLMNKNSLGSEILKNSVKSENKKSPSTENHNKSVVEKSLGSDTLKKSVGLENHRKSVGPENFENSVGSENHKKSVPENLINSMYSENRKNLIASDNLKKSVSENLKKSVPENHKKSIASQENREKSDDVRSSTGSVLENLKKSVSSDIRSEKKSVKENVKKSVWLEISDDIEMEIDSEYCDKNLDLSSNKMEIDEENNWGGESSNNLSNIPFKKSASQSRNLLKNQSQSPIDLSLNQSQNQSNIQQQRPMDQSLNQSRNQSRGQSQSPMDQSINQSKNQSQTPKEISTLAKQSHQIAVHRFLKKGADTTPVKRLKSPVHPVDPSPAKVPARKSWGASQTSSICVDETDLRDSNLYDSKFISQTRNLTPSQVDPGQAKTSRYTKNRAVSNCSIQNRSTSVSPVKWDKILDDSKCIRNQNQTLSQNQPSVSPSCNQKHQNRSTSVSPVKWDETTDSYNSRYIRNRNRASYNQNQTSYNQNRASISPAWNQKHQNRSTLVSSNWDDSKYTRNQNRTSYNQNQPSVSPAWNQNRSILVSPVKWDESTDLDNSKCIKNRNQTSSNQNQPSASPAWNQNYQNRSTSISPNWDETTDSYNSKCTKNQNQTSNNQNQPSVPPARNQNHQNRSTSVSPVKCDEKNTPKSSSNSHCSPENTCNSKTYSSVSHSALPIPSCVWDEESKIGSENTVENRVVEIDKTPIKSLLTWAEESEKGSGWEVQIGPTQKNVNNTEKIGKIENRIVEIDKEEGNKVDKDGEGNEIEDRIVEIDKENGNKDEVDKEEEEEEEIWREEGWTEIAPKFNRNGWVEVNIDSEASKHKNWSNYGTNETHTKRYEAYNRKYETYNKETKCGMNNGWTEVKEGGRGRGGLKVENERRKSWSINEGYKRTEKYELHIKNGWTEVKNNNVWRYGLNNTDHNNREMKGIRIDSNNKEWNEGVGKGRGVGGGGGMGRGGIGGGGGMGRGGIGGGGGGMGRGAGYWRLGSTTPQKIGSGRLRSNSESFDWRNKASTGWIEQRLSTNDQKHGAGWRNSLSGSWKEERLTNYQKQTWDSNSKQQLSSSDQKTAWNSNSGQQTTWNADCEQQTTWNLKSEQQATWDSNSGEHLSTSDQKQAWNSNSDQHLSTNDQKPTWNSNSEQQLRTNDQKENEKSWNFINQKFYNATFPTLGSTKFPQSSFANINFPQSSSAKFPRATPRLKLTYRPQAAACETQTSALSVYAPVRASQTPHSTLIRPLMDVKLRKAMGKGLLDTPLGSSSDESDEKMESERKARRHYYNYMPSGSKYSLDTLLTTKYEPGFIDTHCHLDFLFERISHDGLMSEYLPKLSDPDTFPASYEGCVTIFCKPWTFRKVGWYLNLISEDKIWAAFGCHPHFASKFGDPEVLYLRQALLHPKVVALGEIGLDYSGWDTTKEVQTIQKDVLRKQLAMAIEFKKPLVIHCRDAHQDCIEILKEIVPREHRIHRHCFTEGLSEAQEWLSTFPNMYLGFTNLVTQTNTRAVRLRQVVTQVPIDRILLETDAPYFRPYGISTSGQYSNPGMAIHVAAEIASLRNIDIQIVLKHARENTRAVYGV